MPFGEVFIHNHGYNSVAKGQKHRKKNPPPLSMLLYNISSSYGHSISTLIRGNILGIFFATYYVHDCTMPQRKSVKNKWHSSGSIYLSYYFLTFTFLTLVGNNSLVQPPRKKNDNFNSCFIVFFARQLVCQLRHRKLNQSATSISFSRKKLKK